MLKISSLWFFQELRNLALRHLDRANMSSSEKIIHGRAYNVPKWLLEGLCAFGNSRTFINTIMSNCLGDKTTLRLHQIRDRRLLAEAREDTDDGVFSARYSGVSNDVDQAFADELKACEKAFKEYDIPPLNLTSVHPPPTRASSPTSESFKSGLSKLGDQLVPVAPAASAEPLPLPSMEPVALRMREVDEPPRPATESLTPTKSLTPITRESYRPSWHRKEQVI